MPPDINTGPPALAAGPPGRAAGLTAAGPPGTDPLAALFASLLARSNVPAPTTGIASAPVKPGAARAEDKTQAKAQDKPPIAALPTLPPLMPIQMRPFPPPTAGVTVGQKTTDQKTTEKTMDTSPAPAPPPKDKADGTGGELPLPGAGVNTSAAPAPSPALLITSQVISQAPPAVPFVADHAVAPSDPRGRITAAPSLPTVGPTLRQAAPAALPGVFAPGSVVPTTASVASLPSAETASPQPAPAAGVTPPRSSPVTVDAAPDLTNQPQVIQAVAAQGASAPVAAQEASAPASAKAVPLGLPVAPRPAASRGAAATNGSTVTDGRIVKEGKVATEGGIPTDGKSATEGGVTRDGQAAMDGGGTRDGQAAMEGKGATDGKVLTGGGMIADGQLAKEGPAAMGGRAAMDGQPAMDGGIATDGKMLTEAGAPKTDLKPAAVPADTITRSQATPAEALAAGLQLQVVDKPSDRRAQSAEGDAALPLPTPLPAQAGAAGMEAKPLSAADRADVVRQAAEAVSAMPLPAKPGASEQMTLHLHPKEWGQLQVSVTVTPGPTPGAAQTVTAHVVAQNPQVKAALENQSGDLRQALRAAGLHLDKISVTVQRMEASAQPGTATSGGRHEASHGGADQGRAGQGMGGAFGETTPDQKTGMSAGTRMSDGTGMSGTSGNGMSFTASGGSQGGRQGGQPPAYAAAYIAAEPEDAALIAAPRRPATGQIDMRA